MLLKQLMLLSCLAWTFNSMIDGTQNIRAAFKAQRALDEGESRMSRTKQDAYDALNLAPETIETKLTFQHYVTIISQNMPLIGDTKS
jgi:hypothetical protein